MSQACLPPSPPLTVEVGDDGAGESSLSLDFEGCVGSTTLPLPSSMLLGVPLWVGEEEGELYWEVKLMCKTKDV